MKNLKEMKVEEMNVSEQKRTRGGFLPLAWGGYVVGCLALGYMIGHDMA